MSNAPTRSTTRKRTWCGPYALALLAGLDYDTAYIKIVKSLQRHQRKQWKTRFGNRAMSWTPVTRIQGMSNGEMFVAGKTLGLALKWIKSDRMTLANFVNWHTAPGVTYLINVTQHYVTVRDGQYSDNQIACWKPVEGSKYARTFVECYSMVRPK